MDRFEEMKAAFIERLCGMNMVDAMFEAIDWEMQRASDLPSWGAQDKDCMWFLMNVRRFVRDANLPLRFNDHELSQIRPLAWRLTEIGAMSQATFKSLRFPV